MAEIEIGAAKVEEYPLISQIDLSFESDYVWKTQMIEDLDSYETSLQRIRLPKTIKVSFQAYCPTTLEAMIRRKEILAVRCEDVVVGYLRLEQDEAVNRLVLKTAGIDPAYRRKGIGSVLLDRVEEIALHNGIHNLVAMVQAKNDPAIRFLTGHGFVFCGYQEFYFRNMEIGLFFSKHIR